MSFLKRLVVLLYVTLAMFVGWFFLLSCFYLSEALNLINIYYFVYSDESMKVSAGALAVLFLIINYVFYRILFEGKSKEEIIAFDNPDGRVSVALKALEDMIKRVTTRLLEVKEVKSCITVSKRGLKVKMKLIITSEVSIPEVTSRVQNMIKQKVQDMIGLDERVNVEIHVEKILADSFPEKVVKEKAVKEEQPEAGVPFQGYRA